MTEESENLEEVLTKIALKIAKQKKGCIFVIMNNKFDYAPLMEQDIKPFSIFENIRRTETLATVDGACIITPDGKLIAYATNVLNIKSYPGWGLRHHASFTASHNGNVVIMSSEEDTKVRIFKNGQLVMQLDPLEQGIEEKTKEVGNILESLGAGTLGAVGIGILAPTVGLSIIPGILVFTSAHYAFKMIGQLLSRNKKP